MGVQQLRDSISRVLASSLAFALALALAGCGSRQTMQSEVHVSVDGSDESGMGTLDAPYASISHAAKAAPGSVVVVHGGDYGPVEIDASCSGSEASPTIIRVAEGEHAVVHANDGVGFSIVNASHISIEGLETEGGTHGISYTSTRDAGERALEDICIKDCTVHGVRGTHGICVYARNDLAPVTRLTIEGCEVFDCECGSSESLVLNGNVDGFLIARNTIHDNNNIGIDMIGFEGTAKHPDDDGGTNPYEVDLVRNGVCRDNVVYSISTEGNAAYLEDGVYDPSADGIYVDGGRDIEIYNNFVFNCDMGLEVATEHSPEDNELFLVSGIKVHDNVIANCHGYTGLCFGGYDKDLGFTEDCEFDHNTLVDNATQIGVQRSRNNLVHANLVVGGEVGVELSEECRQEDMVNDISGNVAAGIEDEDSWTEEYGTTHSDRTELVDGFRSLVEGVGSRFVPDASMMEVYGRVCVDSVASTV